VRDSHDRYANTETAYLLQRLEAYSGCAIVTTNLKATVDEAFLRRFRFAIDFPFPDAALRERIWRGVFPPDTPTAALDYEALSRLALAGGHIRSIALCAAFLAAEEGEAVAMRHIGKAARQEIGKLGKPLPEGQLRGLA
jgi:SpoVK/Ycf46/Vps4 family AAA+-type ATPase